MTQWNQQQPQPVLKNRSPLTSHYTCPGTLAVLRHRLLRESVTVPKLQGITRDPLLPTITLRDRACSHHGGRHLVIFLARQCQTRI